MGMYELRQKLNSYDISKRINSSKVGKVVESISDLIPKMSDVVSGACNTASSACELGVFVAAIPAYAAGVENNEDLDFLLLPAFPFYIAAEGFLNLGDYLKEKIKKFEYVCFGSSMY